MHRPIYKKERFLRTAPSLHYLRSDNNFVVNSCLEVLKVSGEDAQLGLCVANKDVNSVVPCTAGDLAVFDGCLKVSIGVGKLNGIFAFADFSAQLVKSAVNAAKGANAAGYCAAVVGIAVGAVGLIFELKLNGGNAVFGGCLGGGYVFGLNVCVIGSGDPVSLFGVLGKSAVCCRGKGACESADSAVAGNVAYKSHGLVALGGGLGGLTGCVVESNYFSGIGGVEAFIGSGGLGLSLGSFFGSVL